MILTIMAVCFVVGLFFMFVLPAIADRILYKREAKVSESLGIPITYRQRWRENYGYWPTSRSVDSYLDALARFDFQKHWAMCHNEVRLLTGRGGDTDLRYRPVERWFDEMYLDAFTKKFSPLASEKKPEPPPVAMALRNAEPWKYLDTLKS